MQRYRQFVLISIRNLMCLHWDWQMESYNFTALLILRIFTYLKSLDLQKGLQLIKQSSAAMEMRSQFLPKLSIEFIILWLTWICNSKWWGMLSFLILLWAFAGIQHLRHLWSQNTSIFWFVLALAYWWSIARQQLQPKKEENNCKFNLKFMLWGLISINITVVSYLLGKSLRLVRINSWKNTNNLTNFCLKLILKAKLPSLHLFKSMIRMI